MQYIFAFICFVACIAGIISLSQLHLNGILTGVIVFLLVLLAVYSLARIKPKETKPEGEAANSALPNFV